MHMHTHTHTHMHMHMHMSHACHMHMSPCVQVRHYAGDVVYHTAKIVEQTTKVAEVSWLEKNNDTLDSGWLQQMEP